nr:hypothetical protein [Clostridioides difficile]
MCFPGGAGFCVCSGFTVCTIAPTFGYAVLSNGNGWLRLLYMISFPADLLDQYLHDTNAHHQNG